MDRDLLHHQFELLASLLPKAGDAAPAAAELNKLQHEYLSFYQLDDLAARTDVEFRLQRVDSDVFQLGVQHWQLQGSRATLFVLHGYYDHAGLYQPFIRRALAENYSLVIFDLPGHGLSSGPRAAIDSFYDYTRALRDVIDAANNLPKPWHVVGQSTGGAVVLDHYWCSQEKHEDDLFEKTVLMAPLIRARGWRELGWMLPLLKKITPELSRSFTPNSHDPSFMEFLKQRDPLQPAVLPLVWVEAMKQWIARAVSREPSRAPFLIIQGDADKTVDWKFNLQVLEQKLLGARVEIIAGAYHHLMRESDQYRLRVFDLAFDFLRES